MATQVVALIAKLAHIEESVQNLPNREKYSLRHVHAKPILEQLYAYLLHHQPSIPPKSLLGQAVHDTLNQWPKIMNYLLDARLDISNNLSERAIKPFVIRRKGWLFADSVAGAHAAANIYSLIETCKYHQLEPYYYFRYVLPAIHQCQTIDDFEKLLPYNINKKLLSDQIR